MTEQSDALDRAYQARDDWKQEAEQAKRERDEAMTMLNEISDRYEARLAAADTLAEAVKEIAANGIGDSKRWWDGRRCGEAARDALAAYQRERGE